MKINLKFKLLESNGSEAKYLETTCNDAGKEESKVTKLTLDIIARESLNITDRDTRLTIENIMERGSLIEKINKGDDEFTIEEIALIKQSIKSNTALLPYIAFQCFKILENPTLAGSAAT